ncbi:MAG: ROK family transcriptional regulator [Oscillospiraceae bacterium]|nr:ROK family transcriptional regulator [Oscillospiraceae bacterium]
MNTLNRLGTGRTPSDVRNSNQLVIANLFFHNEALSAGEIAQYTGLSRTSVNNIVSELLCSGFLCCSGKGASTDAGGKKPSLYSLNAAHGRFISVFFSGYECTVCMFDLGLSLTHSTSHTSAEPMDREAVVETIRALLWDLTVRAKVDLSSISALALHCGGIVDSQHSSLHLPIQNPHWGADFDIKRELQESLPKGLPVFFDNACRFSGYSELLQDPSRAKKRIAVINTQEQFVGGCIVDCGELLHGANSLIGEFGHIIVDPASKTSCACGACGCFESLVSAAHLEKRVQAHPMYFKSVLANQPFTLSFLFSAADGGDTVAREILGKTAEYFALVIRSILLSNDPDEIILQGVYGGSGRFFRAALMDKLSIGHFFGAGPCPLFFSTGLPLSSHLGAVAYCRDKMATSLLI